MPIRSEWTLAREGVTADTILHLLKLTALNPLLTLPLFLAGKYTLDGRHLTAAYASVWKSLKTLLVLGLADRVSRWLDDKVANNWVRDEYVWSKEVVVVTGGSDGIGGIVVRLLAEKGIKVVVLDVQALTYEAPPTVTHITCDLSSPTSIASAAEKITTTLGPPTVLINNAGVARGAPLLSSSEKDLNLTFKVNTLSHYHLAQHFVPAMVAANHGMVVTVASLAGYITAPAMVSYAASKAGAIAFHEGLAAELVTHYRAPRVRTVLMCQGYTRTKLFEGFGGQALWPETVAEEIVKAVLGGRSRHLVLPEAAWGIAPRLRALPGWMQDGMRKRLDGLMRGWKGRQVGQPSEEVGEGEEKEKEDGVESSTVLVAGE